MFDRMPPAKLARARQQATNTSRLNKLAHDANGFTTTRVEKQRAERALIDEVGEKKARTLIRQAADKACK